jgi:Uma2 family endonuclease
MATAPNVRHRTLEDFLAWEREQPQRYEWISGVIRMMARSTTIASRSTWRTPWGGDCEVFTSNVKVVTPAGDVIYPDVVVACGDIPGKATVLDAPVVIVEVLSESTASVTTTASDGRIRQLRPDRPGRGRGRGDQPERRRQLAKA